MRAALLTLADRLRESYWFLPSLMAFAAVLLAGGMVWLDSLQGSDWMDGFVWLYASRPSGARQLLSAIGGSMVTVAGTVFSGDDRCGRVRLGPIRTTAAQQLHARSRQSGDAWHLYRDLSLLPRGPAHRPLVR